MASAGVGPLCFLKSTVNAAIYQETLEHFMLPSADKLYGDADFIFQQDLAPAHTAKEWIIVLFFHRPNGVDDLLKLAKQFDFNMFRQDEEEAEDQHQQSLEDPSEEILDLENDDQDDFSPSLPGNCQPAVKAAAAAGADVHLDQHMDDDLDFLFDGPTQHVSGNLSQVSSAQPSQVKPASGLSYKEVSGKPLSSSHGPTSGVSSTNTKETLAINDFEDDWENDDLLNDSLVLEMTQNPQTFAAPMHSSTQKAPSELNHQWQSKCNPVNVAASGGVGLAQSAVSKVGKNNERQRTTFKLESNPDFSVKRIQTDTWTKSKTADKHTQNRFSSGKRVLVEAGSQHIWKTDTTQFHQRTSVASVKYNTAAFTASNSATQTAQSFPQKPAETSSHGDAPAANDLLDEDLSSFFSSDPVWDDPADDDLLCEMCEDVENQIQSSESVPTKQPPPVLNQRAALQPANRTWDNNRQPPPTKQTAGGAADRSLTGGFCAQVNTVTDSFRYKQVKNTSGSTNSAACQQGSSEAPQGNARKDQFTFKKPNDPVSTVTNKVLGKCSAAEIELKKQQAMERRRQRLQAAQNLRAPT
ncbi:hypothetical protein L3Q82_020112 [Scortum barcoo]|uniref:Uncharacterized protein n=1 Tax=Scortum barcoo TaxID=214431 RepID=A0ACB8VDF4_9TELE|nr:hypothetical protein L3Q82_020112 [Scortum barcoo]